MTSSTLPHRLLSIFLAALLLNSLAGTFLPSPVVRAASPSLYRPAQTYSVDELPCSLAAGDFNGDARTDLVTSNCGGDSLSVLLNQGSGAFAPAVNYTVGDDPVSVAVVDLNGDGWTDLVSANLFSDSLSLLINNGSGVFQSASEYAVGDAPQSVTAADFNADGWPDLAAVNGNSSTISVLFNDGSGGFLPQITYPVGTLPVGLAVEDFNGDGWLDLAATNLDDGTFSLLLGGSGGGFQLAITGPAGIGPSSPAAGDFNRDGKMDLAVANADDHVSVLAGNGDGTFQTPVRYAVGLGPYGVSAGDFNLDGKLDLVSANHNSNTLSLLLNDGGLDFHLEETIPVGETPYYAAVGDFNRDGAPDIASVNYQGNSISVLLSDGTACRFGDFSSTPTSYNVFTSTVIDILSVDLNRDGWLDHVAAVTDGTNNTRVHALLTMPDGSLVPSWSDTFSNQHLEKIETADFNHDSKDDLIAIGHSAYTSIWLGNGDGTFQPVRLLPFGSLIIAISDYNRDGNLDLALNADYAVLIFSGNGDGTFRFSSSISFGTDPRTRAEPYSVASGDLNRDGKPDLVTANSDYTISVLLGRGDGTFASRVNYDGVYYNFPAVIADLNQDGILDVLTSSPGLINLYLGNGDGTMQPRIAIDSNSSASLRDLEVGDFNRDGALDLVLPIMARLRFRILFNDGVGGFSFNREFLTPSAPVALSNGDFNRDGRPDLMVGGANGMLAQYTNTIDHAASMRIHSINSGDWEDPATWMCHVPTDQDTVTIESGDTVTLNSAGRAKDLTINGALTMGSGGSLTLNGNWVNLGTFHPGGGLVTFSNQLSQTQTITGATTFHNLTVGSGVTLATTDEVILTGTLTNNGSTLETKTVPGEGQLSYGLAGISLDISEPGSLTSLQVRRQDTRDPYSGDTRTKTGRYWSLNPNAGATGYNVSLTLPTSFTPAASDGVCRWVGNWWDCARGSSTASSITRTGITAFSDWTVLRYIDTDISLWRSPARTTTYGEPVTITAYVRSYIGSPQGGTVNFYDGTALLGTVQVDGYPGYYNGSASFTTSTLGAGTHSITARYEGQNGVLPGTGTLSGGHTVSPAVLTVSAENEERLYGGENPNFRYAISGFVNGDTPLVLKGSPVLSTTATKGSSVGVYPITVSQGSMNPDNYTLQYIHGTLTVRPAPLIVRANDQTWWPGSPFPALTYTVTGFVNGEDVQVLQGQPVVQTSAEQKSPPGTYPITVSTGSLTAENYTFDFREGILTLMNNLLYLPILFR